MTQLRFDRVRLADLLREGKCPAECARILGVSKMAISKAMRALDLAVIKNVALEAAPQVVKGNLDAIAQLQKINDYANELLDLLMRWNRGDDQALQILESQVRKVKRGSGKEPEWIDEYKMKDPRELALKAMQEIRGQLSLQLDIFKTLYDVEAIAAFQAEVLDAIGGVDADTRNRIVRRLKENGALRPSFTVDRAALSVI